MAYRHQPGTFDWSQQGAVEMLRAEWEITGQSASDIAFKISQRFGFYVSKNAVVGKAHRLKLRAKAHAHVVSVHPNQRSPKRYSVVAKRRKGLRKKRLVEVAKMIKEGPPIVYVVPPRREDVWQPLRGGGGIPLTELTEHTCKWPYSSAWNTAATGFCGAAVELGEPYCSRHLQFSFSPKPLRDASKSYGGWK